MDLFISSPALSCLGSWASCLPFLFLPAETAVGTAWLYRMYFKRNDKYLGTSFNNMNCPPFYFLIQLVKEKKKLRPRKYSYISKKQILSHYPKRPHKHSVLKERNLLLSHVVASRVQVGGAVLLHVITQGTRFLQHCGSTSLYHIILF